MLSDNNGMQTFPGSVFCLRSCGHVVLVSISVFGWSAGSVVCCAWLCVTLCLCACLSEELFRCCRRPPPHTGMKRVSPRHVVVPEKPQERAKRLSTVTWCYTNTSLHKKVSSFCKNWPSYRLIILQLDSVDRRKSQETHTDQWPGQWWRPFTQKPQWNIRGSPTFLRIILCGLWMSAQSSE